MKPFLLILFFGSLLNGFLWWRSSATANRPVSSAPEPAAPVPTTKDTTKDTTNILTPELSQRAKDLALQLAGIKAQRTGQAVRDPERTLAAAGELPVAGYLEFLRNFVTAAKAPDFSHVCDPQEIFTRLMERDAVAGMNWLLAEVDLSNNDWSLAGSRLLAYWALKDPHNARAWMNSEHPELSSSAEAWLRLARFSYACSIAGTYPAEAVQLLLRQRELNRPHPVNDPYLASSLDTKEKRLAFLNEVNQVDPNSRERSDLMSKYLGAIRGAGGTLTEYCDACMNLNHNQEFKGMTELDSFRHFGEEPAFLEWFTANFPDSNGISNFISKWLERDVEAATKWVSTQPKGEQRDSSIVGMTHRLAALDPASALDWSLTLTSESLRQSMTKEIYESWSAANPKQANEAFAAKGITPPK